MAMKIYVVGREGYDDKYFLHKEKAFEYLKKVVPYNVFEDYGFDSWEEYNETFNTNYKDKADYIKRFLMVTGGTENLYYYEDVAY